MEISKKFYRYCQRPRQPGFLFSAVVEVLANILPTRSCNGKNKYILTIDFFELPLLIISYSVLIKAEAQERAAEKVIATQR
ncbi:hypothetical protein [Segetibacter sp.]|jgi:hypothetical protein|uniref:hypothetical protein n=1 Tax=Segetibacter sp. TaxID=2231182 RepID=UPI002603023E|nr:hypothetical protein [Segetibacter sp.]MCW3080249.1 hypothetical protein [Segetibacter sp.]